MPSDEDASAQLWGDFFAAEAVSLSIAPGAVIGDEPLSMSLPLSQSDNSDGRDSYRYENTTRLPREQLIIFGRHPGAEMTKMTIAVCNTCQHPVRPEFLYRHYQLHHNPNSVSNNSLAFNNTNSHKVPYGSNKQGLNNSSSRKNAASSTSKKNASKKKNATAASKRNSPHLVAPPPLSPSPSSIYDPAGSPAAARRIPNIIIKPLPPRPLSAPTPPHTNTPPPASPASVSSLPPSSSTPPPPPLVVAKPNQTPLPLSPPQSVSPFPSTKFIDLPSPSPRPSLFQTPGGTPSDSPPPLTPAASSDGLSSSVRFVQIQAKPPSPNMQHPMGTTRVIISGNTVVNQTVLDAAKRKKFLPLSERTFDPDIHCGVVDPPADGSLALATGPCLRSLTCKIHNLTARRSVAGRSRRFDELLSDKRNRAPSSLPPTPPTQQIPQQQVSTPLSLPSTSVHLPSPVAASSPTGGGGPPAEKRFRASSVTSVSGSVNMSTFSSANATPPPLQTMYPLSMTQSTIRSPSIASSSPGAPNPFASPSRAVSSSGSEEATTAAPILFTTSPPKPMTCSTTFFRRIGTSLITASPYPTAYVYFKLKNFLSGGQGMNSAVTNGGRNLGLNLAGTSPVVAALTSPQPALLVCPPEE